MLVLLLVLTYSHEVRGPDSRLIIYEQARIGKQNPEDITGASDAGGQIGARETGLSPASSV
jgi:hypothetical protein